MFSGHIIRSRLVCLALALSGGGAFAQVNAADSAFQKFYAQVSGVGKQTIGYGSGGQLVVAQGVPQISTSGGPVLVDRSVPVLNNSGGQIAANARISVPPAVLGRIIRSGLALVPTLAAGVALYDLAAELGFGVERSGDDLVVTQVPESDPGACYSAPCYTYSYTGVGVLASQRQAACDVLMAYFNANNPTIYFTFNSLQATPPALTCRFNLYQRSNNAFVQTSNYATSYVSSSPSAPPSPVPSTLEALEAAVAAKSGWPSGSRVSQAVADATALQPAEPFPAVPLVTGPATSTGTTTTTENPDGSTTTTTTTHNHTYTGPTINTTTQTISSTCTGGSCNTTTTTETPKVEEQPFTMPCGVQGTPPCEVRLDQSGMPPDGGRPFDQASGEVDPERDSLLSKLSEIEDFELGEWTWTFQLPTGCTPLTMFLGVEVNPCAWQAEIHDIMSVIWILTGIAGAFVIFSRAFQ